MTIEFEGFMFRRKHKLGRKEKMSDGVHLT